MLSDKTRNSERVWSKQNNALIQAEKNFSETDQSVKNLRSEERRLFEIFKTDALIDGVEISENTTPKETLKYKHKFSEFTLKSRYKWKQEWDMLEESLLLQRSAFEKKQSILKEERKGFDAYTQNLKKDGTTFEQREKERNAFNTILSGLPE